MRTPKPMRPGTQARGAGRGCFPVVASTSSAPVAWSHRIRRRAEGRRTPGTADRSNAVRWTCTSSSGFPVARACSIAGAGALIAKVADECAGGIAVRHLPRAVPPPAPQRANAARVRRTSALPQSSAPIVQGARVLVGQTGVTPGPIPSVSWARSYPLLSRGDTVLNLVSIPTSPLDALLRTLSRLICTISGGGCVVIQ